MHFVVGWTSVHLENTGWTKVRPTTIGHGRGKMAGPQPNDPAAPHAHYAHARGSTHLGRPDDPSCPGGDRHISDRGSRRDPRGRSRVSDGRRPPTGPAVDRGSPLRDSQKAGKAGSRSSCGAWRTTPSSFIATAGWRPSRGSKRRSWTTVAAASAGATGPGDTTRTRSRPPPELPWPTPPPSVPPPSCSTSSTGRCATPWLKSTPPGLRRRRDRRWAAGYAAGPGTAGAASGPGVAGRPGGQTERGQEHARQCDPGLS